MDIKVEVTASELIERWAWEDYCEEYGVSVWAVNEGCMDLDEKLTVSYDFAKRHGLIERDGQ